MKQFGSSGCNSGVSETDLNTYKSFTCEECEVEFTLKTSLIRHIRNKHELVKYSCDYCDYRTATKGNL